MKKKFLFIFILIILLAAAGGLAGYYYTQHDLVYSEVTIEAGCDTPDITEFIKHEAEDISWENGFSADLKTPGDYELTILWQMPVFGEQSYDLTLHVVDTTAPVITAAVDKVFLYINSEPVTEADLIDSVYDVTNCTISFAEAYDFTSEGEFEAVINARDTSGNTASVSIPCTIVNDTTAPVIEGVSPIEIAQGDTVSYKKGITVTDDYDDNPTLEVDTTQVNLDKRGFYELTYIARDAAGNESKKTTQVHVVSAKIANATPENVNAMADQILAGIVNESMLPLQKARAIFDWVVNNITYKETAGIDDLYSAAYAGMYYHTGDCTVKQKTAEVMLNRVGIKNMEIEKIRDTRGHYWLLIDIGEGWYHYDPNLQLDGSLIFYWHDADLWNYSNAHKNTHNYDPSKYPHIE